ncbi:type II toxin-antitoxin system PemK/MazF family toxin [Clostridium sp. FAM 1755]|uniref:Type II toxin-antitoxin system PemK/MazF family toxin n=2 Tax=Clostridium TaxID=1485 RepID=A0A6M0SWK3_CLOBO|nr:MULTISPECIES: type II toxin-antitoxin system PemK/MazF family toxin [Clostridium]EJP6473592.1 type II toxin-antitoxin system PemK/MazF family toxin [Clostridium botulinum]KOR25095.1 growth inhibitor PemK [Clostridium sp. L74]MDS1002130.1 type II toxin-antitoxin system PemK/MazF family toxin [Clostridium sporogenes]NFA59654.1 type II toxin-antitoxin system PemK/MazF family toxin [Clostridium botulinum]NFI73332.1 type II toxin-antitoxin system PemK/MazF family toxin [Clostridium sporogenes]
MKNLNDMNTEELERYIKDTENQIHKLLDEYINRVNNKIDKNKNAKTLKEKAYALSKLYKYVEWVNDGIEMNNNVKNRIRIVPKRGEVWTCELGQNIGSEENKIRPVIIIQNDTGNQNAPTTIVVPISNRPKKIAVHISIRNGDFELVKGEKMEITGTVLAEQIRIVSKARLGRHVATLSDKFMQLLDSKIKISLDL